MNPPKPGPTLTKNSDAIGIVLLVTVAAVMVCASGVKLAQYLLTKAPTTSYVVKEVEPPGKVTLGDSCYSTDSSLGRCELATNLSQQGMVSWQFNLIDRVLIDVASEKVVGWRNLTGRLPMYIGDRNQVVQPFRDIQIRVGDTADVVLDRLGVPVIAILNSEDRQTWTFRGRDGKPTRTIELAAGVVTSVSDDLEPPDEVITAAENGRGL